MFLLSSKDVYLPAIWDKEVGAVIIAAGIQKKNADTSKQDRPDVLTRRGLVEGQFDVDPNRPVFMDGTWTSTNMARRRGRALKGERLRAGVP